jgi:hypothetical protein
LQITNNVIQGNGGSYGGAIRVGSPNMGDNHNDNLRIANNRILNNGGHNLAGAVGLFSGTNAYEVAFNDVCGNFASEYGGGISHFGLSPNSSIHDNKIYFNGAYDHGGGVILSGEPPANPASQLSPGTGNVDIYNNVIQANLSNDDGGGIALESVELYNVNVYNNFLVDNVATHQGGGVALDDAPNVFFVNNTVMGNITTATSAHGNGAAAPAGLADVLNSKLLQAQLPGNYSLNSDPWMFNNIFWNNRAGTWTLAVGNQPYTGITGIGLAGDPNPIRYWDMGVADGSGQLLHPKSSILQTANPTSVAQHPSNLIGADPQVVSPFPISVSALPWRGDPHFVGIVLVAVDAPAVRQGDYHLVGPSSPAYNAGLARSDGVDAPPFDIDYDARPSHGGWDIGADQYVAPARSFPSTPVLDTFNRPDGAVGPSWAGDTDPAFFRIQSSALQVLSSGLMYWNTPDLGPSQEAFFTFKKVSSGVTASLKLKINGLSGGPIDRTNLPPMLEVEYNSATNQVAVKSNAPQVGWVTHGTINNVRFLPGDTFGARALSDGTVNVYKNGIRIASSNVTRGSRAWPAQYVSGGGKIGMWVAGQDLAPPK